jgi:hypothetical protein
MPLVIAVYVRDSDVNVVLKFGPKMLNNDRGNYGFPRSWDA